MSDNTSTRSRLELRPVEVGAGAAAAVVTAGATSFLGTAGTLSGAALASVVATVSTSVLRTSAERTTESLQRTAARLREETTRPEPGGSTRADPGAVDPGPAVGGPAGADGPTGAGADLPTGAAGPGPRRPRWAVLTAGAVAAFAVALVAITGIESALGKPLAALLGSENGGGTTVGRTVGGDPAPAGDERDAPTAPPSGTRDLDAGPGPERDRRVVAHGRPGGDLTGSGAVGHPAPVHPATEPHRFALIVPTARPGRPAPGWSADRLSAAASPR